MNKYKVVVYAISKNEEKFVSRWYNSMREADEIYVLDTGSSDNTVKYLRNNGINVKIKKYKKWRFDIARNDSLLLVPNDTDICVCTDLDEVFEPGWREKLEKNYKKNKRVYYTYNWHLNNGVPDVTFFLNKIHPRKNYKWTHPVHEVLEYTKDDEEFITIDEIILNHYPDQTKSRSNYLKLLEESVKEDPLDDRNMHYLGREYMYYGMYDKCIVTLKCHLDLKSAIWDLERCASMRYIARCYYYLNDFENSLNWYEKAIEESNDIREPYTELGILYYNNSNYLDAIKYLIKAKSIKRKDLTYINEVFCYDSTIDDILSICYYNIGLKDLALFHVDKAIELNKEDNRLKKNRNIIIGK